MLRLVMVDDDARLRASLRRVLEQKEVQIVGEASNGRDGVELVRRLSPDCVLMDVHMPILDGLKATRYIKDSMPEIPVIILSALDDVNLRMEAMDAGAEEWFIKGDPAAELYEKMVDLVGHE